MAWIFLGVPACAGDEASLPEEPGGEAATGGVGMISPGAGGALFAAGGTPGLGGAGSGGAVIGAGGEGLVGAGGSSDTGAGGSRDTDAGGAATADCPTSQALPPGDHDFTLASANGITYRYTLVVPSTVVPGRAHPLAVVWHALGSNPEETRGLTHIDATASSLGVITVHPRSPDNSWDVGTCCTAIVLGQRRDETVFARELLADVESKVCVDKRRVYTSGFSNGGMISQMLACKMADVFAASAPMGSTLTIPPEDCHPSRPIPLFMINGTADPLVGYAAPGLSGGLSVPSAFQTWADRDACTGEPETVLQQGKATCKSYKNCAGGAEVTLCSVEGMGHCIPGMKKESPTNCLTKLLPLGMPNDDIDGVDMATEFLSRFALP